MIQLTAHELSEFAEFMEYKKKSEELINEFRRYQQSKKLVTENMQFGKSMDFLKFQTALDAQKPSMSMVSSLTLPWVTKANTTNFPDVAALDSAMAVRPTKPTSQISYIVPEISPGKIPIKTTGSSDCNFPMKLLFDYNDYLSFAAISTPLFGATPPTPLFTNSPMLHNSFIPNTPNDEMKQNIDKKSVFNFENIDDDLNDVIIDRVVKRQKIKSDFVKPIDPKGLAMSQMLPKLASPTIAASLPTAIPPSSTTPEYCSNSTNTITTISNDNDEAHIVVVLNVVQSGETPSDTTLDSDNMDSFENYLINGASTTEPNRLKNEASKRSREKRRERHEARRKEKEVLEKSNIDLTLKLQILQKTLISLRQQICQDCYNQVQSFLCNANSGKKGLNIFTLKKCDKLNCKGVRHIGTELDNLSSPVSAQ